MVICQIPAIQLQTSRFPTNSALTRHRNQTPKRLDCTKVNNPEPACRNRKFIIGMGYVGQFFAQSLRKEEDWSVFGTCTSLTKKKELEEKGYDVCLFDANEPKLSPLSLLKSYTHLLVSLPPVVGVGDPILRHEELLRGVLMDASIRWIGYLSSTSVYGAWGGAWVDEDCETRPTSDVAKSRLAAEEGWLSLGHGLGISTQVLRLGGIYGPGRSAVDTIIKRKPWSKGQKLRTSRQYTSRIHVEDICQALRASIQIPGSGRTYNIVDDDPAPREEVFAFAEELIQKKWPGMGKHGTSCQVSEYSTEKFNSSGEKRVSNARMKRDLGVKLLYPSYRSGLQSIIDQMEKPFQ
ncbi:hypothetical protein K2173_007288 [Erythroxylum novogranatense]|uniref:NAD-dependent epimerase/dehydratase domain-containing protein n=1 Tax=Erythroxylum novogranatense TaxID=1862640 RepID=A0AAV8T7E3_9ROSI|nr:hypothetical protein K2173_007288 [Erythroxylum novogranatense]